MEEMYQQYKDIVEFRVVYINEAHPEDSGNPASYAAEKGLKRHTDYNARCTAAELLMKDKQLTIPCLIDGLDNAADLAYHAWPDKVFLIRKDGRLAIAGEDGPIGFAPAMNEAWDWLSQYRETGQEPILKQPAKEDFRIFVSGEQRPSGPQDQYLGQIAAKEKANLQNKKRETSENRASQNKASLVDKRDDGDLPIAWLPRGPVIVLIAAALLALVLVFWRVARRQRASGGT